MIQAPLAPSGFPVVHYHSSSESLVRSCSFFLAQFVGLNLEHIAYRDLSNEIHSARANAQGRIDARLFANRLR
jgi:hypothetical protein